MCVSNKIVCLILHLVSVHFAVDQKSMCLHALVVLSAYISPQLGDIKKMVYTWYDLNKLKVLPGWDGVGQCHLTWEVTEAEKYPVSSARPVHIGVIWILGSPNHFCILILSISVVQMYLFVAIIDVQLQKVFIVTTQTLLLYCGLRFCCKYVRS